MTTIQMLTEFFGWCTVLNIGIYMLTALALTSMRDLVYRFNAKLFTVSEQDFAPIAVQYLGHYKLAITILFFVPWAALKIIA